MKAIIQCYTPEECERIANGEQTVKVCKTAPKDTPFKVYIYQTKESKRRFLDHRFNSFFAGTSHYKDMGKVIGEFICDKVEECIPDYNPVTQEFFYNEWEDSKATCLTVEEEAKYGKGKPLYGLHISELKIYDKPRELSEFLTPSGTGGVWGNHHLSRPPQSWCYVEEN